MSAPAPVAAKYEIERLESLGDATFAAITIDRRLLHLGANGVLLSEVTLFGNFGVLGGIAVDPTGGVPRVMVVGSDLVSGTGRAASSVVEVIAPGIVPVVPGRLLDTRATGETVDGLFEKGGRPAADSVTTVQIAGRGGVPDDAGAAILNLTAVRPSERGFVTVYPCDEERPGASNLNYIARQNAANSVVAKLDADGQVCLYTRRSADLLIDVNGFVPVGGSVEPVVPKRYLDTRQGDDVETFDGESLGAGRVGAGSVTRVRVAGRGVVPDTATAVLINVTAVGGTSNNYLTVYSCDDEQPTASNLNAPPGANVANLVLSGVSSAGEVCIYSNRVTHLVADVNAHLPGLSSVSPLTPARLFDGRSSGETIDGIDQGRGAVAKGSTTTIRVTGRGSVPDSARGVVLNVTSVRSDDGGFLTVYPCDEDQPTSSNLNFVAGQVVANFVAVKLSASGTVCVFSNGRTDLVVDVTGWVA